ncbi:MAG: hypothetical protein WCR85_00135 [Sphaerochaeta sp.]
MKHEEVAAQYNICDATVGRTVKRVRAYLKDLRDLQLGANAEPKTEQPMAVSASEPAQDRQIIPRAGENILDQVTDFAKVTHASASAGVVVGCATDSIIDGLTNPELSDEEGLRKTATGFASIGGFIYGSLKASQRLRENHPPRRED